MRDIRAHGMRELRPKSTTCLHGLALAAARSFRSAQSGISALLQTARDARALPAAGDGCTTDCATNSSIISKIKA